MIRFEAVSVAYRSAAGAVQALADVSLEIKPSERVVLLGANGSGKSTLAKLANGLLVPGTGTVTVDGMDTRSGTASQRIREYVGMVFQHPDDQIVATSVEDDVAFGPENLGLDPQEIRRRVDAAIGAVALTGLERREPHLLSGGQKQRLAVAGALAMAPRYLVLDEPTSMLDPDGRIAVLDIIRRVSGAGAGVLHITHDVADAAGADLVVVLSEGMVVFRGSVEELLGKTEYFGVWGLEVPVATRVAREIERAGWRLSAPVVDVEDLEAVLWR